jgi:MFS family permease
MFVGGLFLFETPNSLIERGYLEEGKKVLMRIRGTEKVQAELDDLMEASKVASAIEHPFANLFHVRNRPQLVMAFCLPIFQILTGINSILFYAPIIFQALGFGNNASLYASVFTGGVMVVGSVVTILTVDRFGRRLLLITGGVLMVVCQVLGNIYLYPFLYMYRERSS